jgi:hypothetical protein
MCKLQRRNKQQKGQKEERELRLVVTAHAIMLVLP